MSKDITIEMGKTQWDPIIIKGGVKYLDLNGHTLKVMQEQGPDNQNYKRFTAFEIKEGTTLVVFDSSKKQNGVITCDGYIPSLNNIKLSRAGDNSLKNFEYCRNVFEVKGNLYLSGGSIIAGRSKEYWLTTPTVFNPATTRTSENGRFHISGTAVNVRSSGSFTMYSGTVKGRGLKTVAVRLEKASGGKKYKLMDAFAKDPHAAIECTEGGSVAIYDGNIIGNAGAYSLNVNTGIENSYIYSAYLEHNGSLPFIVGHLEKPLEGISGYNQHLATWVFAQKFTNTDLEKRYRAISIGRFPDESTVYFGEQEYDDGSLSQTIRPEENKTANIRFEGDVVISEAGPNLWEKGASAKVKISGFGADAYFPEDSNFQKYAKNIEHSVKVEFKASKKGTKGKWVTYGWRSYPTGDTVDLKDLLCNMEEGAVCQIEARVVEHWKGTHTYDITYYGTEFVNVKARGELCDHDYEGVNDTSDCQHDGHLTSVCRKCGCTLTVEVKKEDSEYHANTKMERTDSTCWKVCLDCGQKVENTENIHAMEASILSSNCEKTVVAYDCKYGCGLHYTNEIPGDGHPIDGNNVWSWDENKHWTYCSRCHERVEEAHIFKDGSFTCSAADSKYKGCSCGYTIENIATATKTYVENGGASCITLPDAVCGHMGTLEIEKHWTDKFAGDFEKYKLQLTYEINWYLSTDLKNAIASGPSIDTTVLLNVPKGAVVDLVCRVEMLFGQEYIMEARTPVINDVCIIDHNEPTCVNKGIDACKLCATCGIYFRDKTPTAASPLPYERINIPIIPATGIHEYENSCSEYCKYCGGAQRSVTHSWDSELHADEYFHYELCQVCGAHRNEIPHTVIEVIDEQPACGKNGKKHLECTVCGWKSATEYILGPAHDYEMTASKEATCTSEGSVSYKCKNCTYSYTETVPKLEHSLGCRLRAPATCLFAGEKAHRVCFACGGLFEDSEELIPTTKEKLVIPIDPNNHVSIMTDDYSFDENNHYMVCACGAHLYESAHVYLTGASGRPCFICGYTPDADNILSQAEKDELDRKSWAGELFEMGEDEFDGEKPSIKKIVVPVAIGVVGVAALGVTVGAVVKTKKKKEE